MNSYLKLIFCLLLPANLIGCGKGDGEVAKAYGAAYLEYFDNGEFTHSYLLFSKEISVRQNYASYLNYSAKIRKIMGDGCIRKGDAESRTIYGSVDGSILWNAKFKVICSNKVLAKEHIQVIYEEGRYRIKTHNVHIEKKYLGNIADIGAVIPESILQIKKIQEIKDEINNSLISLDKEKHFPGTLLKEILFLNTVEPSYGKNIATQYANSNFSVIAKFIEPELLSKLKTGKVTKLQYKGFIEFSKNDAFDKILFYSSYVRYGQKMEPTTIALTFKNGSLQYFEIFNFYLDAKISKFFILRVAD